MALEKDITAEYRDVIDWLNNIDPFVAEEIINTNITFASSAFSKPFRYVDQLIERTDFSNFTEEEERIMAFYFNLCRKRMR